MGRVDLTELHDAWDWNHSEGLTKVDIQEDIFTQVSGSLVGIAGTAGGSSGIYCHMASWGFLLAWQS